MANGAEAALTRQALPYSCSDPAGVGPSLLSGQYTSLSELRKFVLRFTCCLDSNWSACASRSLRHWSNRAYALARAFMMSGCEKSIIKSLILMVPLACTSSVGTLYFMVVIALTSYKIVPMTCGTMLWIPALSFPGEALDSL